VYAFLLKVSVKHLVNKAYYRSWL